MKKTNKKGFTLVELVIVIAVIAILAAVLIPVFANLISKAKDSAALQNARNTFEQYAVEHATDGEFNLIIDVEGKFFAVKEGNFVLNTENDDNSIRIFERQSDAEAEFEIDSENESFQKYTPKTGETEYKYDIYTIQATSTPNP